jgi:hypothetical protein
MFRASSWKLYTEMFQYCNVLCVFNPFTSRVYVTDHFWTPDITCLLYLSLLNTKCNVLKYWRRRSVYYSGFFTSLVVTRISFYNVLWPSDVASQSGPGSSALVLWSPSIWSSLICVGLSLDLLVLSACWSAFCDLSFDLFWSAFYLLQSGGLDDTFLKSFVSRVSVAADLKNSVA